MNSLRRKSLEDKYNDIEFKGKEKYCLRAVLAAAPVEPPSMVLATSAKRTDEFTAGLICFAVINTLLCVYRDHLSECHL